MDLLERFIDDALSDMPRSLKAHVDTVVNIALDLSKIHGCDRDRVYLAAKGHDISRLTDPAQLLELAKSYNLPICDVERVTPMLLHGPVGAHILSEHMDSFDQSIFEAVYWHTIGNHELDNLGKVVFLSDKLDPVKGTRYPYQRLLYDLASKNLDHAMKEFLNREIISLVNQGYMVHPDMLTARNKFINN